MEPISRLRNRKQVVHKVPQLQKVHVQIDYVTDNISREKDLTDHRDVLFTNSSRNTAAEKVLKHIYIFLPECGKQFNLTKTKSCFQTTSQQRSYKTQELQDFS